MHNQSLSHSLKQQESMLKKAYPSYAIVYDRFQNPKAISRIRWQTRVNQLCFYLAEILPAYNGIGKLTIRQQEYYTDTHGNGLWTRTESGAVTEIVNDFSIEYKAFNAKDKVLKALGLYRSIDQVAMP